MTSCVNAAHAVWVNEEDMIISFHAVDGYKMIPFTQHTQFVTFIMHMTELHFRFQ